MGERWIVWIALSSILSRPAMAGARERKLTLIPNLELLTTQDRSPAFVNFVCFCEKIPSHSPQDLMSLVAKAAIPIATNVMSNPISTLAD